ncbi:alpha-L-rhamnosidase C-terminal domain-containing protein [Tessaracoccus coleopterorum]|uniref:alpha-L-rhamnosidase C-terminal domain-containing protein n=1 Tax=Tessaracoccus coleopterorum TaxID=2714950 RepID=UPI0022B2455F|nr:alpha-L-rhamnosidase C-terminal domain-containing protein [Tessaracoccus coleopterorum]
MPDGSFGPVGMNSFNHYAYGAVGEWMYRTMAGVSALEPGYSRILIAPVAGAGIDEVDYRFDSSYGTIGSSWSTDAAGTMTLNVVVPRTRPPRSGSRPVAVGGSGGWNPRA